MLPRFFFFPYFPPFFPAQTVLQIDVRYPKSQQCHQSYMPMSEMKISMCVALQRTQPFSLSWHAFKHTYMLHLLQSWQFQKGKLQRSRVVALGFPSAQLEGLWIILTFYMQAAQLQKTTMITRSGQVLWIALATKTLIWYMTPFYFGWNRMATWSWFVVFHMVSLLLTHSYSKPWNQ